MTRWPMTALPIVAIVAVVAIVTIGHDSSPPKTEPVNIEAAMPTYETLDQLVQASSSVVIARASDVRDGRTLSSDIDPSATIHTQIVTLLVGEVLHGPPAKTVTLEQEIALGDGTPITVNHVRPTVVGDEGLFFLDTGDGRDAHPYAALVNHQARYLVTGANRDQLVSASSDSLSLRLASLGPYELRCQVLAAGAPSTSCATRP